MLVPAPGGVEGSGPGGSVGEEAPGQLVTHYAPDLPTYILRATVATPGAGAAAAAADQGRAAALLAVSVVIDFGGALAWLKGESTAVPTAAAVAATAAGAAGAAPTPPCLAYRDLSPSGDSREAGAQLFAALRWAEGFGAGGGARRVLLADVAEVARALAAGGGDEGAGELAASVADRCFRAASGRVLEVAEGGVPPPRS